MNALTLLRRHWGKALLSLVLTVAVCWLFTKGGNPTKEMLTEKVRNLSAFWFIVAYCVLPLVGFPISALLVLAGVKFGFWHGMTVAAGGIAVHHFAAYFFVHGRLREWMRARLAKGKYRIPVLDEKNQIWFTAAFAAIHGPSYALKLYLLALTEVKFRIYFWVGAPVYLFFCAVPVGAGSSAFSVNPVWLYVGLSVITGLAFLVKRILKHRGEKTSGNGRRKNISSVSHD